MGGHADPSVFWHEHAIGREEREQRMAPRLCGLVYGFKWIWQEHHR